MVIGLLRGVDLLLDTVLLGLNGRVVVLRLQDIDLVVDILHLVKDPSQILRVTLHVVREDLVRGRVDLDLLVVADVVFHNVTGGADVVFHAILRAGEQIFGTCVALHEVGLVVDRIQCVGVDDILQACQLVVKRFAEQDLTRCGVHGKRTDAAFRFRCGRGRNRRVGFIKLFVCVVDFLLRVRRVDHIFRCQRGFHVRTVYRAARIQLDNTLLRIAVCVIDRRIAFQRIGPVRIDGNKIFLSALIQCHFVRLLGLVGQRNIDRLL